MVKNKVFCGYWYISPLFFKPLHIVTVPWLSLETGSSISLMTCCGKHFLLFATGILLTLEFVWLRRWRNSLEDSSLGWAGRNLYLCLHVDFKGIEIYVSGWSCWASDTVSLIPGNLFSSLVSCLSYRSSRWHTLYVPSCFFPQRPCKVGWDELINGPESPSFSGWRCVGVCRFQCSSPHYSTLTISSSVGQYVNY